MATAYILHNPKAGTPFDREGIPALEVLLDAPPVFRDITAITDYPAFFSGLEPEDYLIIAGGDGTLNHFANHIAGLDVPQKIYYYPVGTGNDFARDMGKEKGCNPFPISHCLKELPSVTVNGHTRHFLNAVGFGIDGYCCEVGDEQRKIPGKKVNYTAIAIKGLLGGFSPRSATVTVDGVRHTYEKVWIAPTMHGRYYGGGMIAAPDQDRLDPDRQLSLMLFHGAGKLRTLCVFPSIFKGTHVKHTNMVQVFRGHEITVEFDRPTPLQIDGETVLGVTSYTAVSAKVPAKV